jgi:LEA14-like dessication related protein
MRQFIVLSGIIVSMGVLFAACGRPEPAEYYGYQNLQVSQVVGGKTNVSAIVKLYNPNKFGIKLKRAEVDIRVNGRHAGHSLLDSGIDIPAKDTFYVPVNIQLDMQGLFSNALQLLLGKREATVDLDGRVRVKRGMFTFNRSFHYEGKQDLSSLMPKGSDF